MVGLFLSGNFQQLLPTYGVSHAQNLHMALVAGQGPDWIFNIWRTALALANVVVIVILIFIAVVNILHLQYDTYAIKKSVPLLIGGVIMSNFSLLICRMIVDAAQVIANTFASDPGGLARDLLCSIGFSVNAGQVNINIMALQFSLVLIIFVFILILIAVLILSFLLWIRLYVIYLLVAVAPVAFILYAFPPTQSLFKQWWSWFIRWVFMGPIIMLLVWVASRIGANNCTFFNTSGGGTGFSFSALLATVAVLYLAAIIPFKLGGAVMGAWSNLGKKGAGLAGKGAKFGADYGTQKYKNGKYAKWGPTALVEGFKEGAVSKRKQDQALATGSAKEMWARTFGKRSDAAYISRRYVGQAQYKEGTGGIDLANRPELGRAFNYALHNNELPLAENLMIAAAERYMIGDIMGELDDETKMKLGYTKQDENGRTVPLDKLDEDLESQREFVRRVSKHNNRFLGQIEDLWQSAGVGTAMSVFGTDFQPTTDDVRRRTNNIKRFNSPDPMKAVRNFRADAVLGKDGTISEEGFKYLREGLLNQGHLELLADGYGREATYNKLNTVENIQKIDAEIERGGPGTELLQGLKAAITSGRGYPAYTEAHAQKIQFGEQEIDINQLSSAQAQQPEIQAELSRRAARMSPRDLDALSNNVGASGSPQEFKDLIAGVADLRKAIGNVRAIDAPGLTHSQSSEAMQNLAQTISQQIGKGIKAGIDPRALISSTLGAVHPTTAEGLKKAIQEGLAISQSPVSKINGQDASSAQLINLYKQATDNGRVTNDVEIQRNWVSMMQRQQASPDEIHRGWEFVQAYKGEKPPEETPAGRRGRGRNRRRQEFYEE